MSLILNIIHCYNCDSTSITSRIADPGVILKNKSGTNSCTITGMNSN